MSPEKETFHVVIRIPTKRPQGFVEPPSIVWTDEMEHKLWQYMSQKNTDWNVIAEQLGVPTSYIVRHAAFIYETQLRGIHQQLRLNVNNSSMTKASIKSPTPSLKKPASGRYSNTLQQQQQYIHDMESQKQLETRNNNGSLSNLNNADMVPQSPIDTSDSSVKTTRSPSHSLYKSSMLQIENTSYKNESSEDDNNNGRSMDSNDSEEDDDDEDEDDDDNDTKEDDEEDEEERFSSHFERIKLQVEEPAFLARRLESSTGSLSASRNQLSLSIQNLRKPSNAFSAEGSIASPKKILSPQTRSPATRPGSNNESAINSSTSSFSDISETSVTQSAMEDAFLSNFDHAGGSKISSFMSFTRK